MNDNKTIIENEKESKSTPSTHPPIPPFFRDCIKRAEQQIELNTFDYADRLLAMEVCRIIAEVYLFSGRNNFGGFFIDGEKIQYKIAEEVYSMLRPEHVEYVIEEYRGKRYLIINPKAYFRAMLYNSVFKLELCRENEFRSDYTADVEENHDSGAAY